MNRVKLHVCVGTNLLHKVSDSCFTFSVAADEKEPERLVAQELSGNLGGEPLDNLYGYRTYDIKTLEEAKVAAGKPTHELKEKYETAMAPRLGAWVGASLRSGQPASMPCGSRLDSAESDVFAAVVIVDRYLSKPHSILPSHTPPMGLASQQQEVLASGGGSMQQANRGHELSAATAVTEPLSFRGASAVRAPAAGGAGDKVGKRQKDTLLLKSDEWSTGNVEHVAVACETSKELKAMINHSARHGLAAYPTQDGVYVRMTDHNKYPGYVHEFSTIVATGRAVIEVLCGNHHEFEFDADRACAYRHWYGNHTSYAQSMPTGKNAKGAYPPVGSELSVLHKIIRKRPSQTYDNKTSLAATARAADEDGEAEAQKAAKARTTDEDWAETYNFMALDLGYEFRKLKYKKREFEAYLDRRWEREDMYSRYGAYGWIELRCGLKDTFQEVITFLTLERGTIFRPAVLDYFGVDRDTLPAPKIRQPVPAAEAVTAKGTGAKSPRSGAPMALEEAPPATPGGDTNGWGQSGGRDGGKKRRTAEVDGQGAVGAKKVKGVGQAVTAGRAAAGSTKAATDQKSNSGGKGGKGKGGRGKGGKGKGGKGKGGKSA